MRRQWMQRGPEVWRRLVIASALFAAAFACTIDPDDNIVVDTGEAGDVSRSDVPDVTGDVEMDGAPEDMAGDPDAVEESDLVSPDGLEPADAQDDEAIPDEDPEIEELEDQEPSTDDLPPEDGSDILDDSSEDTAQTDLQTDL